jgi:aryl-alcohol dehydrogenase-like predicted oxidoreductase
VTPRVFPPLPSRFALGTEPLTYVSVNDAARLYSTFREAGQCIFDTAHCYTYWNGKVGSAEKRLGELVRKLESRRDDVFIITKGGHIPVPGRYDVPDRYLSPELLARQLEESLSRLDVGPVDLYLLHRDDPRVPADEHLAAVQPFLAAGHVKRIGVSNWLPARIDAANAAAARNGWTPFTASEVLHNLAVGDRKHFDPLYPFTFEPELEWYQRSQFPLIAFTATAHGYFAGHPSHWFGNPISDARRHRAKQLASQLQATPTQIALAYLLTSPFPCTPLFGIRKLDELTENLASVRFALTPEQRRFLECGEPPQ